MATCEASSKVTTYRLELTEEEAQVLLFVLGQIGGSQNSPRKHTDPIWNALQEAGVMEINPKYDPARGAIYFSDYVT